MGLLSTLASAVVNLIVRLRGPVEPAPEDMMDWWEQNRTRNLALAIASYDAEISRLRRNKKKHSHLVAQRDALMREAGR